MIGKGFHRFAPPGAASAQSASRTPLRSRGFPSCHRRSPQNLRFCGGPVIKLKSSKVNLADFKVLPPAKRLYAPPGAASAQSAFRTPLRSRGFPSCHRRSPQNLRFCGGPVIKLKSSKVNLADFKVLPPAKRLYAPPGAASAQSAFRTPLRSRGFPSCHRRSPQNLRFCGGPVIKLKSSKVNLADFKVLPPAKRLYAPPGAASAQSAFRTPLRSRGFPSCHRRSRE